MPTLHPCPTPSQEAIPVLVTDRRPRPPGGREGRGTLNPELWSSVGRTLVGGWSLLRNVFLHNPFLTPPTPFPGPSLEQVNGTRCRKPCTLSRLPRAGVLAEEGQTGPVAQVTRPTQSDSESRASDQPGNKEASLPIGLCSQFSLHPSPARAHSASWEDFLSKQL